MKLRRIPQHAYRESRNIAPSVGKEMASGEGGPFRCARRQQRSRRCRLYLESNELDRLGHRDAPNMSAMENNGVDKVEQRIDRHHREAIG